MVFYSLLILSKGLQHYQGLKKSYYSEHILMILLCKKPRYRRTFCVNVYEIISVDIYVG